MSFFKQSGTDSPRSSTPVSEIDLTKRYDIYSSRVAEDRLYENVKIVGLKILRRSRFDANSIIGGYVELEAPDGTRMMIPQNHVEMLCEHGVKPIYKVLFSRRKADLVAGEEPKFPSA